MKIFLICSKTFYDKIPGIKNTLEDRDIEVTLPNCFDDPTTEEKYRKLGNSEHSKWKAQMLQHSTDVIEANDGVLVLNFEKNGIKNYIGGATFLEMYDAFRLGKYIFMYNEVPDGILKDEIMGFDPRVINGDLSKVR